MVSDERKFGIATIKADGGRTDALTGKQYFGNRHREGVVKLLDILWVSGGEKHLRVLHGAFGHDNLISLFDECGEFRGFDRVLVLPF